jgi:hypothetical protein
MMGNRTYVRLIIFVDRFWNQNAFLKMNSTGGPAPC